jgi:spore maturation protein CgeB
MKSFLNPSLKLEDERKIYSSSIISLNIHENYQKKFGGDCNERTFKIPACGGFEITDYVKCIGKYFKDGKEIIMAKNKDDWFDKIDYYIKNPEKRISIIENGRKVVMRKHTYHNRVKQLIKLYEKIEN